MKKTLTTIIMVASLAMIGCKDNSAEVRRLSTELSDLKLSLGNIQFMGLDPKLSFSISKTEFIPPSRSWDSVQANITVNVKEHATDFPAANYLVTAELAIRNSRGDKVGEANLSGNMEIGVLSISEEITVYGLKHQDLAGYSVTVEEYSWYPETIFKPFTVNAQ